MVTSVRYGQCILVLGPEIPLLQTDANHANRNQDPGETEDTGDPANEERDTSQPCARDQFKDYLIEALENEDSSIQEDHFRAVAQQYEDHQEFSAESLRAEASDFFLDEQFKPSEIHKQLADLPFTLTISTTHDLLYDMALKTKDKSPKTAFYNFRGSPQDNVNPEIPVDPQTPLIYYLFGHIDNPNSLVLSENDLADFLIAVVDKNPPIPDSIIKAMRKGSTLLFIGFGLKHWYLRVLLKIFLRALELHQKGSKIVTEPLGNLDSLDLKKTISFYRRGIRIHVNNSEVLPFIEDLKKRLEEKGGFTQKPAGFTSSPKVFISYASQDKSIAERLHNSLSDSHFDSWFDKETLEPGDAWNKKIKVSINESDFLLVVCSKALKEKQDSYVNKEISWSLERSKEVRGKFIVPVETDDIQAKEILPELGDYQAVNIVQEYNTPVKRLIKSLRREYQRRNR